MRSRFELKAKHAVALAVLLAGLGTFAGESRAEGAIAIGRTNNVRADGIAFGWATGYSTREEARRVALAECRKPGSAPQRTRDRCKVVETFRNKCVAVALDPKDGTPGAGWAIADTKEEADEQAMEECRDTAGRDRRRFCQISGGKCDED